MPNLVEYNDETRIEQGSANRDARVSRMPEHLFVETGTAEQLGIVTWVKDPWTVSQANLLVSISQLMANISAAFLPLPW